jgi:1,2-diacylglycerol 3-beta-glucosyltransferase
MRVLLATAAVLIALPGAGAALHLGLLALASLAYREPRPAGAVERTRFLVLVPAHNEEPVIGATLAAIGGQRRPWDRVTVVADRCTDATAAIAAGHGAEVLERGPGAEPGRAAARQDGIAHALRRDDWDALVMIDADSLVQPDFFDACERMLAVARRGRRPLALQARSEAELARGLVARASLAAFALQGLTIPRGRDVLGLSVRLRGTGMVLRREVVERFRFRAPASEDLFYGLDLCLAGILPRHVESARLRSQSVRSWGAAGAQRQRYEAGRMGAAREFLPELLRRSTPAALEAAWFLATPPFAVAAGSLAAGLALALASGVVPLVWSLAALAAVLAFVLVAGLVQARAGLGVWVALLAAPWYVLWKVGVQLRALASVRRRQAYYAPTARR